MRAQWQRERPDVDPAAMVLFARLTRANAAAAAAIDQALKRHELNRTEFDVLASLRRSGDPFQLSPGVLARALVLSPAAMTNRLDRLEAHQLVTRGVDPTDARVGVVALTPRGRRLVDDALLTHVSTLDAMLEGLTPRQRDQLSRLLSRLDVPVRPAG
jgi:DNA-binding MarR family transcriptional regulator